MGGQHEIGYTISGMGGMEWIDLAHLEGVLKVVMNVPFQKKEGTGCFPWSNVYFYKIQIKNNVQVIKIYLERKSKERCHKIEETGIERLESHLQATGP
jgi:hypothetical protein